MQSIQVEQLHEEITIIAPFYWRVLLRAAEIFLYFVIIK